MIHLDGILIVNHNCEEYINTIKQVLQIAKADKLWFNRHKCQCMLDKLAIIGDHLTDLALDADPDKVNTIPQFREPDQRRLLQRFLVMVNYLTQFCPERGTAAAPLLELHVSIKLWKWTDLH